MFALAAHWLSEMDGMGCHVKAVTGALFGMDG
jgi:hypothetical protein